MKNNTWHLVSPQLDQNIIDRKWVYKVKCHADGAIFIMKMHIALLII